MNPAKLPCACELFHGNFAEVLAERADSSVDIVYMDLGVSSMQLDRRERGFSYAWDAPLDMRMDPTQGETAADLVNTLTVDELTDIFRRYGEERYAHDIARRIERQRAKQPLHEPDRKARKENISRPIALAGNRIRSRPRHLQS